MADPKWLTIAQIGLDTDTENVSSGAVTHPLRTYEGRVLDWGTIEKSIPIPSGLPRVGDALIRVADTDRKWRNLLSRQTPRRRRVTTKFMQAGTSESATDAIYSGEIKDGAFPEGVVDLQLRDTTFSWIDEPLPLLITQQNFPNFPDVNPAFLPIILGQCQSRAIPPGSSSGGPAKSPTGQSAILQAAIATAASMIAAYTAVDLVALGPTPPKVDRWVTYVENEYGRALSMVIDEVNRQYSSGVILIGDLQDARDNVQDNVDAFIAKAAATGAIDSDWLQITNQSVANQRSIFGANFEFLLGPLDAMLNTLTSSPTVIASYVQGVIPLPHIGYLSGTGDRWAASRHQLWNVLAIYRKLPGETIFTVVDPAEFNVVEEDIEFPEHPGVTFTCVFIDFILQQDDGCEIRMDADGFYFRDVWNGMPAVGYDGVTLLDQGALRNPIDGLIHLTRVGFVKASLETGWDGVEIETVYDKFEDGTDFTPPYYCDAAIVESLTPREILERFTSSFGVHFYTKRSGLQSINFIEAEDLGRLDVTEQMMVKGSFKEYLANPTCNQLAYRFMRDYAEEQWMAHAVYENAYDQAVLGEIEKGELDLWFVRDQGTAVSVAGFYMQYVSLGSYRQEWQSPLPLVLDRMELTQQVGVTHRSGLEYVVGYEDREVVVTGTTIDLGQKVVTFRSILRSPVRLPIEQADFEFYSDFVVNASQVPSTQTDFPVGIVWTDARFKTVAYGGRLHSASGFDLRPFDATGTTPRTFELVWYDETTGSFEMWVLMSSIDDADVIRMKYGNTAISTDGSSPSTWPSSYKAVYHYGSPTSLSLEDSTSNAHDATGVNTPTASSGQLGGAVNIANASSELVTIPNSSDFEVSNTDLYTWEFWMKRSGAGGLPSEQQLFYKLDAGPEFTGWRIYLSGGNPDIFRVQLIADFGAGDRIFNTILAFTITADWWYFVVTYDGSGLNTGLNVWTNSGVAPLDRNGSLSGSSVSTVDISISTGTYDGQFDEVRMSKGVARSNDYAATSHNNQSSMVGFWTLLAEVAI